ncbi:diguanylate cyclase domain-containing protein [Deinococcus malanensis]|uniref:diguanylate cyclase domain-containing protein n=1 Tax=Deinococcus malanensis TaxID=1706855 RepID=UPI00362DE24E
MATASLHPKVLPALGVLALLIVTTGTLVLVNAMSRSVEPEEVNLLTGLVRLGMALPLLLGTVALVAYKSALPSGLAGPAVLAVGALGHWMTIEGLSSFYGEVEYNDWLEIIFGLLMMVAFVWGLFAVLHQQRLSRAREQRAREYDPLTGLLNRTGLQRHHSELSASTRATMLMFDLNDLKAINDSGGHGAGDQHIRAVAKAIQTRLPDDAIVGRWGGDEFVAVIPHVDEAQALEFARAVEHVSPQPPGPLPPFSVGAACIHAGESFERALAIADQRMYECKQEHYERSIISSGQRGGLSVEDVSKQLEMLETPDQVLDVGLALARELLGFEATAYFQPQDGQMLPTHLAGLQEDDRQALRALDLNTHHSGMVSSAITSNSTTWTADYPADPRAGRAWVEFGLKSAVVTPVRSRGEVVGVLALMHFSTWRAITPAVRRLLETVALRLGHTIERLRVIEDVRVTLEGGLLSMGLALEARDLETSGHTERVVGLSLELGQALGLSPGVLSDLKQERTCTILGSSPFRTRCCSNPAGWTRRNGP